MPTRTVTRRYLSASTNGSLITANTASPGTLLHTAVNDAINNSFDEVYVCIRNVGAAAVKVYCGIDDMTDPTDLLLNGVTIPAKSFDVWVVQGKMIGGGLNTRIYANTASAIVCDGWVRRTTITT